MKKFIITTLLFSVMTCAARAKTDVAAFYAPFWRGDAQAKQLKADGWPTWGCVKTARPLFKGHMQPKYPYVGFIDGSSPNDAAIEIELAGENGIDVFLYGWHWFNGEPQMQEALENGFLKAKNNARMRFALVWDNRDRLDICRPKFGEPRKILQKAEHSAADTLKLIEYCIEHYFDKENYWKLNGKLYLAILEPEKFIAQIGGAQKTRELLEAINQKMRGASLPNIHWAANASTPETAKLCASAGFASAFAYGISPENIGACKAQIASGDFIFDYAQIAASTKDIWAKMAKSSLPIIPALSRGRDASPLCRPNVKFPYKNVEYPYAPIVINNTSDKFEALLKDAKKIAESGKNTLPAVFIDSWNNWAEGSAVFPERIEGMNFLRAICRTFAPDKKTLTYTSAYDGRKLFKLPMPDARIQYAQYGKNGIDFWRAQNSGSKKAPTIVYIHGGGWTNNSNIDNRLRVVFELRKKGYNIAAVSYRLVMEAHDIYPPVKAPMQDCSNALATLVERAGELGIDKDRIALTGGSAGACTSLWISLNAGKKLDSGKTIPPVKIAAVVVPQTTLDPKLMKEWIPNSNYGAHAFNAGNFKTFLEKRDSIINEINEYSPYSLLEPDRTNTKFFLVARAQDAVGTPVKDPTHGAAFCIKFKEKCDAMKIPCQTHFSKRDCLKAMELIQQNL